MGNMVKQNLDPTLARPIKQFQLVGRAAPTQKTPVPKIYRMKIFAASKVLAKSKFWYFMKKVQGQEDRWRDVGHQRDLREEPERGEELRHLAPLPQPHGPAQHVQGVPRPQHQRRRVADVR